MGRETINAHHHSSPAIEGVSCGLPPAEELAELMRSCGLQNVEVESTPQIYVVSATVQ